MNIRVCNREEAMRTLPENPTAIISIYTPGDDPAEFEVEGNIRAVMTIAFDDVDNKEPKEITYGTAKRYTQPITASQATEIAEFIHAQMKLGIENFIVHCDAGISRSPGVAVAMEEIFNENTRAAFTYPLHNKLVYRRMADAMHPQQED